VLVAAGRNDDGGLPADQICRECRQSIVLALGPAILDRDIAALGKSALAKAFAEGFEAAGEGLRGFRTDIPDQWHRQGLGAQGERQRCRTADRRDEVAPPHGISVRACKRARIPKGALLPTAIAWHLDALM
jgi:hypothetical protein